MREDAKNLKEPDPNDPEYGTLVVSLNVGDKVQIGDCVILYTQRKGNYIKLCIRNKKTVPIKRSHLRHSKDT